MVKFSLPDPDSEDEIDLINTTAKKPTFKALSDEEDENDNSGKKFKFKLKRNQKTNLIQEDTFEDDYSELFVQKNENQKRNVQSAVQSVGNTVKVLNLEDLEGSEEDPEDGQENDTKMSIQKKTVTFDPNPDSKVTEKSYVKLLSKQDKEDLKELGITAQADINTEVDDVLMMEDSLQDERLALGDKENRLMQQRKRQEIEQLIALHDDRTLNETDLLSDELQQLQKMSGKTTVLLPKLQPEQTTQELSTELTALAHQDTKEVLINKRIEALENKLQNLSVTKEKLLEEFFNTCKPKDQQTLETLNS
ncbi:Ntr2 [Kluyveromyces marxianus]